jgi:hypothetical protein
MPNTLQLAVDPYLLCLPDPCTSEIQIQQFVNALLGWSTLLRRKEAHVLVSDAVRAALLADGEYPHQHRLRDLLRILKCEIVDHETVCRLAQSLLDRTPSLEDTFGVRVVLLDESKTAIEPRGLVNRLKRKTRAALAEMLVIVSVGEAYCATKMQRLTIVASTSLNGAGDAEEPDIALEAELHDLQWAEQDEEMGLSFPLLIRNTIPLASCHEAILRQAGVWKVWDNASSEDAAIDAIELCVRDLMRVGLDDGRRIRFRLGGCFLESVRKWGFSSRSDYAMVLVESCARIILDAPKNPLNAFRIDKTSTKQRVRKDGALAYRTHLTKKGPGYRLMFWRLPDGTVEFANVGDKDELTIL